MIDLHRSFADQEAPNANAIKNAQALVSRDNFVALHKSDDDTLLFGACRGSGSSTYHCSCDFRRAGSVTYGCSCPSRQFPCKHCLGLLYAYADGRPFSVAPIPADVVAKRARLDQRGEKPAAAAGKPRKVNKSALKKKIDAQLRGLDLLEQLTHDLVRTGMGNMTAKTASQIEERAKQLANAYLPGAQAALHQYTTLFCGRKGSFDSDLQAQQREAIYSEALDQLTRLNALVKHGRNYLRRRLDDPDLAPDTESPIAAWLGHAWQLRELKEAGLVHQDAELIQLAFHNYDDIARREYIDSGIWMNLGSGALQVTLNYRPYRAARFIKAEDSFFQVAQVPELCVYPGGPNPRVRWDTMAHRPIEPADLARVQNHAHDDFAALAKQMKNHLKSPLADKRPVAALRYERIGRCAEQLVVEDAGGTRLVCTEIGLTGEPASCHLLWLLPREMLHRQTLIARFHHDLDTHTLRVKPLSLVTRSQVFRLTF